MKKLVALLAVFMIWPAVTQAQTFIYQAFPSQPYAYQPYDGEGEASIARYQYDRAILEQDREEKRQWDNFARKHALPIARPDEPLGQESSQPTNMVSAGFKVVHPPETTSSTAPCKTRELAE